MIIGNGDIARIISDRNDAIIFAAGVSNSQCVDESEFNREMRLIASLSKNTHLSFFYFSSMSIFFKDSRYTEHKKEMESFVRNLFPMRNIIRLGNITWGDNPNTFINYIGNKIAKGEDVEIRDEMKFIITSQTLRMVVNSLPAIGAHEISVFDKALKVKDALNYKEWMV